MRFEGLREGPKSVGNEKPRRVIGAGTSKTQPELALLPSALITTSNAALSSGAVAAAIVALPDCWGCLNR